MWNTKRTPSITSSCSGCGDQLRGHQHADRAVGDVLAQARVDIALRRALEVLAELVHRTPRHGRADEDVLAGRLLDEARGRDDRDLALGHLLRRGDAQRAAKVVGVAVREDDARHRLVAQVLAREGQRRGGTLACGERVDDDEARLAFDQRHVGDVEAAQLPDAVGDLEQPDLRIQHRVPPQARVDGGWRLAVDELVGIEVDQHRRAIGRQDLALWARDQTTLGVLEILRVVELEFGRHLLVGLQRGRHGVTGGAADAGVLAASGQQGQQHGQEKSVHRYAP